MSRAKLALGEHWERVASEYLERQGLAIVARRYRCRLGELDLVCEDGATLVIVEVRARAARAMVKARDSVDHHKRQRLIRATRHFLMRHPRYARQNLRFDVIAIDGIDTGAPRFDWIKQAFESG